MLQFLNPIWFFAAAAMLIPVVIHLWNIRPGKVLKVGSTSLIAAASRKSSRSFKFLDIPLLLLRCLLLLLIAALLTSPIWQKRITIAKAKGWVLLPKENFSQGYSRYKTSIDSLTKLGYEFRYFNAGFPKADLVKLLAETKDLKSIDSTSKSSVLYWNLLAQLDNQVPSDLPVYLFTSNSISHFAGNKTQSALNLHWQTFTPADSVSTWVQDAWFNANNTIKVVQGTSKPLGTTYNYVNIQADKGNAQFAVNVNNGQPEVSMAGSKGKAVPVDTTTLRIAVYTDRNTADAGYLKAALDAVGQFTQRKTVIKSYSNSTAIPAHQSWVFWLSEQAVPAKLLQQPINIFAYQSGKQASVSSWISTDNANAVPAGTEQVPLFKIVSIPAKYTNVIWHDGYGHPVLASAAQGKATVYHFFTRFSPTWNDLAWSSNFPRMILQLVNIPAKEVLADHDRRSLIDEQIQPLKITESHTVADQFTIQKELASYFWLALVVVFFIERWLATRNKRVEANG